MRSGKAIPLQDWQYGLQLFLRFVATGPHSITSFNLVVKSSLAGDSSTSLFCPSVNFRNRLHATSRNCCFAPDGQRILISSIVFAFPKPIAWANGEEPKL